MAKQLLKVQGSFHGVHFWPSCPDRFRKTLGKLHEHEFGFVALIAVSESRQIEFLELAASISSHAGGYLKNNMASSCEDLATALYHLLHTLYKDDVVSVEVNEDGGCGSIVVNELYLPQALTLKEFTSATYRGGLRKELESPCSLE